MKILYIADDGRQFENEYECSNYEFGVSHPHLKTIELYNNHNERLIDPLDDETYFNFTKIIIHSEEELIDLYCAADYTGFSGYYDIKSIGIWVFDQDKEEFVRYVNVNPAFNQELSDKYVKILKQYTTECDHEYADTTLLELLQDLGYTDVVEEYKTVPKWYS